MRSETVLSEWRPTQGFNLQNFRDFKNFPQYDITPYILKFRFSDIQTEWILSSVAIHFMGWNIPECRTNTLFSKIMVSKNGFQDIYYNQPSGSMGENFKTLRFDKEMVLRSPEDMLIISFFPLCPAHMVDVDAILFLTNAEGGGSTPPPSLVNNQKTESIDLSSLLANPQPYDHYWYIYATVFAMVLMLLVTMLFSTINQPKKYIVIRRRR